MFPLCSPRPGLSSSFSCPRAPFTTASLSHSPQEHRNCDNDFDRHSPKGKKSPRLKGSEKSLHGTPIITNKDESNDDYGNTAHHHSPLCKGEKKQHLLSVYLCWAQGQALIRPLRLSLPLPRGRPVPTTSLLPNRKISK